MEISERISRHEVLRRWAIGELHSEFFNPDNELDRAVIGGMLVSGKQSTEVEAMQYVLERKQAFIDMLPPNIKWYRAILDMKMAELDQIYTIQMIGWERNTNGTFLIADAAINVRKDPALDMRVTGILNALRQNEMQLTGITLLAEHLGGPFTAIEGNGRLVSLYITELLEGLDIVTNNQIEIVLGLMGNNGSFVF